MANLLDTCPTCFEIALNECADFIVIEGGFIVFEDYVIIITDKFGHEYRLNLTAGYDGELTIDVTDLPDGLFTAYSGVFTVKVYESDGCTPATITFCEEVYTCLKLTFKTVLLETDDDIIEYIKCCEEEPIEPNIILNRAAFICDDSTPTISLNLTVTNTSGEYRMQIYYNGDWQLSNQFNGVTSGEIIYQQPLQGSPGNGTFNIRVIDRQNQSIVSYELPVTIVTCK